MGLKQNFNGIFFLSLLLFAPFIQAQDIQSLEFDSGSEPGDNTGPETTITIPLRHNINNPTDNVFSNYLPLTSATITINNLESGGNFLYAYSQNTNENAGDTDNPPVVMGWRVIDPDTPGDGSDGNATGASSDTVVPFTDLSESIDPTNNLYSTSEMEDFYSSTLNTVGDGISFSANRGVFISAAFEGLRDANLDYQTSDTGNRYHMANMTISFDEPIDNPILHFFGLGGFWELETDDTNFINAAAVEFDFDGSSITAGSFTGLSILSANPNPTTGGGTTGLAIEQNSGVTSIISTWNIPDVIDTDFSDLDDAGVANGSVLIEGNAVESITFEIHVRAVDDIAAFRTLFEDDEVCPPGDFPSGCVAGSNEFGWGGGETYDPDGLNIAIPEYNIAHDLFVMSISSDVDPDEQLLESEDCYRMLSSPVEGTTYGDLLAPLWTQGVTGSDHPAGDPNIWLWSTSVSGESENDWQEFTDANGHDMSDVIPPGSGFLISVFADDDFEDPGIQDNKLLSATGSENAPLLFQNMNTNAEGWTLLGNPFKSTIDFDNLYSEASTNEIEDAVYVYDRELSTFRSYVGGVAGDPSGSGYGDLTDGLIAPFQGFFVQNLASGSFTNNAQVDFTDDVKSSTEGPFHGKENNLRNFVRLELNGESLYNSMWIRFSEQGSLERTRGEALELQPMSTEYAILGTKKADGTIYDISHYPIPNEQFEIPVSLETTRPGYFTITATDLDLSFGSDLYFIDLQEEKSIRIDGNFSYEFSTEGVAKTPGGDSFNRCSVGSPQKAKTFASADRFVIATQPKEFVEIPSSVALNQNYPNPFNPTTQISYDLPQQSDVRLEVYDLVGRQVATLVNQTMEAGSHTVNFNAGNLSSGVYVYRLNAGNTVLSRKLTVIK